MGSAREALHALNTFSYYTCEKYEKHLISVICIINIECFNSLRGGCPGLFGFGGRIGRVVSSLLY